MLDPSRYWRCAYKLDLPEELSRVHKTFHVSNLKKCHANEPLAVPLDGLHFDDKLHFCGGAGVIQNGKVAYKLKLPQELNRVHHTFHVSNVKKCYSDESLVMPLEGVHMNDTLQFVGEPVEIMEREIKQLKRSRIPLVKVRWNSRRGHEFTWEREDSFKKKYPYLFTNRTSSSTTKF
nr:putative reverse transcriptase domain-containing protein [Tanacetum cinerariifolium]